MLEPPHIQDQQLISRLQQEYNLSVSQLAFLALGADVNTAVYRVIAEDGTAYFLKLRFGYFDEITVSVPQFLKAQGNPSIIAPLETNASKLWAPLGAFKMVLYPYIEGLNGYKLTLTDRQWLKFGAALKNIHTAQVPPELTRLIPRETFLPFWRDMVKSFQAQIETTPYPDPVAAQLVGIMKAKSEDIHFLVARVDELAQRLRTQTPEFVLCHSDIHPGNLLLGENDTLYIVDWDNPSLAPIEHDLQLIGGCATWHTHREEALFYQGYGLANIDPAALTYYRYERIIEDIAAYCQQLLSSDEGGPDREQSLTYFKSIFLPGHEIDLARQKDRSIQ
jgi:spectinomycin phosphotransferase